MRTLDMQNVCLQTYCINSKKSLLFKKNTNFTSKEFLGLRMRIFQSIIFI